MERNAFVSRCARNSGVACRLRSFYSVTNEGVIFQLYRFESVRFAAFISMNEACIALLIKISIAIISHAYARRYYALKCLFVRYRCRNVNHCETTDIYNGILHHSGQGMWATLFLRHITIVVLSKLLDAQQISWHDILECSYLTLVIAIDLVYLNQINSCSMFTFLTTRTLYVDQILYRMFCLVGIGKYCCSFNRKIS